MPLWNINVGMNFFQTYRNLLPYKLDYRWGYWRKKRLPCPEEDRWKCRYGTIDNTPMMKTVQSIPPDGSTNTPSHFPHLSHLPHIAKKQRKLTMEEHLSQLYPVWDDVLELYEKHRKSELAIQTWCFWRFFHEAEKILERFLSRNQ